MMPYIAMATCKNEEVLMKKLFGLLFNTWSWAAMFNLGRLLRSEIVHVH